MKMGNTLETDVLIVGAGITGLSIARELSKYRVHVTVIDKESDVGMGISKTSGGLIYMGLFQAMSLVIKDLGKGSDLEAEACSERMQMLWEGFSSFDSLAHDLDIAHKHVGVLVFARDEHELGRLRQLQRLSAYVPGGTITWLDRKKLFVMEPNLTSDAIAALHDTTGAISVFGSDYVIAVYENARANGVEVRLETQCMGIDEERGHQIVSTNNGPIKTRFVINCAGKYADRVADMAESRTDWNLLFYRSQALILDKRLDGIIHNVVGIPPEAGKIDFLYPLGEGNIHVYGGYYDLIEDGDFVDTTSENYDDAIVRMKRLVPSLSAQDIITSYVGVRVFNDRMHDENLIESSPRNPHFINVIIRMPGFTPATRIAAKVVGMLADNGLKLDGKDHFLGTRRAIPRFRLLADEGKNNLISKDPGFGRVVCRCETVTEGEIVAAIQRGARTIQGVMFRTRAGMGRCQRNTCGPKILEIMARELEVSRQDVTFKGPGSSVVISQLKGTSKSHDT
jgi:glycerol-3-phosphate dehydrogenase